MNSILELQDVSKRFEQRPELAGKLAKFFSATVRDEIVQAVDSFSLSIRPGEIVGLVGESGCGKSTIGRLICGLMKPSQGTIRHQGQAIDGLSGRKAREIGLKTQMIFQSPSGSLNPRMRVKDIIGEAPMAHGIVSSRTMDDYVVELLGQVGLDPEYRHRLPHQFSGGQRQRIGIARALAVRPEVIVCDESVSALDVSIQAQILNLFLDLQRERGLTYVFISHDLRVIAHISTRVVVMYLGRIVEIAQTQDLFARARHPYTLALLESAPKRAGGKHEFYRVEGEIPSPLHPPAGCHFHPRCPIATARCRTEIPALREVIPGQFSRCHYSEEVSPSILKKVPA